MDKELLKRAAPDAEAGHDAVAIGLDLESADNLPWSGDPSSESFYVENFTGAEMAWCLRQRDPRLSFCGLWCAKEAAIKCAQEFAGLRPIELEVLHDEHSRPRLQARRASQQALGGDCLLSISHAGQMGLAVCVRRPKAPRFRGACELAGEATVGAKAVVTKDVPAGATVVGSNRILPNRSHYALD